MELEKNGSAVALYFQLKEILNKKNFRKHLVTRGGKTAHRTGTV